MNVDFTLILCINEYFIQDLIPGPVYKINITACVEDINKVVIESKPLHEKITVTDGGKLSIFREEPDRERRHSVLARQMSTAGPELTPWRNWAIVAELITDNDCVCILHDSMSGINVYIWYIHIINCQLFSSSSAAKNWGTQYVRVSVLKRYLIQRYLLILKHEIESGPFPDQTLPNQLPSYIWFWRISRAFPHHLPSVPRVIAASPSTFWPINVFRLAISEYRTST